MIPAPGANDAALLARIAALEARAAALLPALSISDVTEFEGTGASGPSFAFIVTLAPAGLQPVTVHFATADGTAELMMNDYLPLSGNLTFAPGETSKQVVVAVARDDRTEPNKTFFVNLSNPTNAVIADSRGLGTIKNDDFVFTLELNDSPPPYNGLSEGNTGSSLFVFTVKLSTREALHQR